VIRTAFEALALGAFLSGLYLGLIAYGDIHQPRHAGVHASIVGNG